MLSTQLIREARKRAGLTQRELAERAGTSQPAIARYETGISDPSLETLRRIVRACDLDLRVGLEPADDHDLGVADSTLALTPTERVRRLESTLRFIAAGRRAMAEHRGE